MHDSNFWYQYITVGPRGEREVPEGAQHPLALLRSAYDTYCNILTHVSSTIITYNNKTPGPTACLKLLHKVCLKRWRKEKKSMTGPGQPRICSHFLDCFP